MSTAIALLGIANPLQAAGPYEGPDAVFARDILPAELVRSPSHELNRDVVNDGFMYNYIIKSPYGELRAISTGLMRKRVAELNAVATLASLSKTDEFGKHLAGGAKRVVSGAEKLITNPLGTLSSAAEGVGKILGNASESIFGVGSGGTEEEKFRDLIGFAKTKREYAQTLDIDVYSRNEILQKHLDDVAWAAYMGGITTSAASIAISGGVGTALSVASNADRLSRVDMTRPPVELRKSNHDALVAMGTSAEVADLLLNNDNFTLTEQTLFVAALTAADGVAGRAGAVKVAVNTDNPNIALFRRRQAQMYATAHRDAGGLNRFITIGRLTGAVAANGSFILAVPVDHLRWTAAIDNLQREAAESFNGDDRHLWLSGTASDLARAELTKLGWTVTTGAPSQ
ncbi:MAG: hypothetical protein HOI95_25825 [Chromatiales bacterium]|nr:hypothetical protein [Chromatiales bacterium]